MIDFIYGVNLSRALTQAFKNSNNGKKYHNLSIGRVQGPALAFVVDKEISIRNHIPVPYWTINAEFEKNGHIIEAHYHQQKIEALSEDYFNSGCLLQSRWQSYQNQETKDYPSCSISFQPKRTAEGSV